MKTFYTFLIICLSLVSAMSQTAVCNQNVYVSLNAIGEATITPEMINQASSDYVTLEVNPSFLDCDDIGNNTITLTATDSDGNTDACTSIVMLEDKTPPVAICNTSINVALDAFGTASIFPENLDDGSFDACTPVTLSASQLNFDCSDIGINYVTLTVTDDYGNSSACVVEVDVQDKLGPVVLCQNISVALDEYGSVQLYPSDITSDFYDNCPGAVFTLSQEIFTCADLGDNLIDLVAIDASGNVTTCSATVTILEYANPTPNLACNDYVLVFVSPGESLTITSDIMLEGGPYACPSSYTVTLTDSDGNVLPSPVVDHDDGGETFVMTVTDNATGNSCWGELEVFGTNCPDPFLMCDTECNAAPLGDCDSGHTDQDNLEWPCDITLFGCELMGINPSPATLLSIGVPLEDTAPQLFTTDCQFVGYAYDDNIFNTGGIVKYVREWTVIDWFEDNIATYVQVIEIISDEELMCDTLPWNAPVGDCNSGHTLSDPVEWPADITINTFATSLLQLASNPDVHPNDVEPSFVNDCDIFLATYVDETNLVDATTLIVTRTWTAVNWINLDIATYVQTITANGIAGEVTVCAHSPNGDPIPDVNIDPSGITDDLGCASVDVVTGIQITADKDDPLTDGVDIFDQIILMESLLGIRVLSDFETLAGDLNQDGALTPLDVVILKDIIAGASPIPNSWLFVTEEEPYNDYYLAEENVFNYPFIGIKLGDLDNSFDLGNLTGNQDSTYFLMMDDVINNGESYDSPITMTEDITLLGFQIMLDNSSDKIAIESISSDVLPGFSMDQNVRMEGDQISIKYTLPLGEIMMDGLAVADNQELLFVHFTANDNGIVSEEIKLMSDEKNILRQKETDDITKVIMSYEEVIVNNVEEVELGYEVKVFPNPASNYITVTLDTDEGLKHKYQVYNMLGEVIIDTNFAAGNSKLLDVYDLTNGSYMLTVINEEGKHSSQRLLIIR